MGVRIDYLLGQGLPWTEDHTLGPGQTTISLAHAYKPGSRRLAVFLNGVLMFRSIDYTETNANRIDFLCEVKEDDRVFLRYW